jgi:hypothetical protein
MHLRVFWLLGLLVVGSPSDALPRFAREYGETCQKCHSIPPRLNSFGQAFQANYYNWPGGKPPARTAASNALPLSALATFSLEANRTEDKTTANFRELELFLADGWGARKQRRGGFLVDTIAATTEEDERAGNLEEAFAAIPVTGGRGQGALVAGQFSPLRPQWEHHTQLTETSPAALADDLDGFSFAEHTMGLRADYFDRRHQNTADGDYLALGVPFKGAWHSIRTRRWADRAGCTSTRFVAGA